MWAPGSELTYCGAHLSGPPSAQELLVNGFIGKPLAHDLSDRLRPTPMPNGLEFDSCLGDPRYVKSMSDGYDATLFHKQDLGLISLTLSGREPTDWQRAAIPGADLYYLFSLKAVTYQRTAPYPDIAAAASLERGSTFEVWFPFVLAKDKHYTLQLSDAVPEIQALSGTLKNNVLRFALPSFALKKGVIAHGEIDGSGLAF